MSPTSPESQQSAHLEKLHAQLQADIEAMQEKEANLRAHEEHLRQLLDQVAVVPSGLTQTPAMGKLKSSLLQGGLCLGGMGWN
jgi:hypothetical protein